MADCRFGFVFPGSAEELVRRIAAAVAGAGGTWRGDAAGGSFSVPTPIGVIEGGYLISGQSIDVNVTGKPWMLPCGTIRSQLEQYLRQRAGDSA